MELPTLIFHIIDCRRTTYFQYLANKLYVKDYKLLKVFDKCILH